MNISEIRKMYPQYEDVSDDELARGLHKKYYSDMDYDQFSQKIGLSKTPEIEAPSMRQEQWYDMPRAALQGMTFGFSDEIGSALAAIPAAIATGTNPVAAYKDMQQSVHNEQKQYAKDNLYTAMALEAGGGMLTGGVGGLKAANTVLKGASLPVRAAAIGATEGGIYGLGSADEGERLSNAGIGALAGGVLGGVGAPVLSKGTELGTNALGWAAKKFNDPVERRAQRIVRNQLLADNSIDDVLAKYTKQGADGTLADADGNIATIAQYTTAQADPSIRNQVREQMHQRNRGQFDRFGRYIGNELGVADVSSSRNLLEGVKQARKAQATPLYEEAYQHLIPINDRIAQILERSTVKSSLGKVAKNLSDQDIPIETQINNGSISIRAIDELKKVLDDQANKAARKGENHKASLIGSSARELRDIADETVPIYKEARGVYAGAKALEDARQAGADIFKPKTDVFGLENDVARMGESEKQMFKSGVLEAIAQKTGKAGYQRNIMNQFDSPDSRMRLQAAFGNDERKMNDFIDFADREMNFNRVKGLLDVQAQSQTALLKNHGLMGDVANDGTKLVDAVDQGPTRAAWDGLKNLFRTKGIDRETANRFTQIATDANLSVEDIRQILTAKDPLDKLQKFEMPENVKLALAGAIASIEESMRQ